MKKYFTRLILFFLILFSIFFLGMVLPDKTPVENLHYSIIDKHAQLQKPGDNRVILVGGSSLSFGIYSQIIKDSLNRDVINMAINAGYGLKFLLDDARQFIRPNDMVILIPEYAFFFGTAFYGEEGLLQAIDAVPSNKEIMTFRQWLAIMRYIPRHSLGKWKALVRSPFISSKDDEEIGDYERRSFNEMGDVISHWEKDPTAISDIVFSGKYNPNSIEYIKEFEQFVLSRDAEMYISYPSLIESSLALNEEVIKDIEKLYKEKELKILGTPERYSLDTSLYYNTHYHLTREGQFLRTRMLLEDLERNRLVP